MSHVKYDTAVGRTLDIVEDQHWQVNVLAFRSTEMLTPEQAAWSCQPHLVK
jgi:hypothetical protein